jgi:hypothetical protein
MAGRGQEEVSPQRGTTQTRRALPKGYEHDETCQKDGEEQGMREATVSPVAIPTPNRKPMTSRSGMTEQSAPATQTRFGVTGL